MKLLGMRAISAYELVSYKLTNITNPDAKSEFWWMNGVQVEIVLRRRPMYYTLTFVVPCALITALAIFGIFIPSNNRSERTEKVTMGLTALLTLAVLLLMVSDMTPKSNANEFPLLDRFQLPQQCECCSCTHVHAHTNLPHRPVHSDRRRLHVPAQQECVRRPGAKLAAGADVCGRAEEQSSSLLLQ